MSRNIKARRRMALSHRRRACCELQFNKCGPDLRWRQYYDDNWDIIWPSSPAEYPLTPRWHPVLMNLPALHCHLTTLNEMSRFYTVIDPYQYYTEGEFENILLGEQYDGCVTNGYDASRQTQFDGFDISDDGPYALDWRHGPGSDSDPYTQQNALLWRVRRPWWVI